jgi:hypothetical protein
MIQVSKDSVLKLSEVKPPQDDRDKEIKGRIGISRVMTHSCQIMAELAREVPTSLECVE